MRADTTQRGGILMLMTLSLPVLIGAAGLVLDKGYLYVLKRQLQVGTDATAISAAHEIRRRNPAYHAVALRDAQVNGLKPNGGDTLVIARPPTSGLKAGDVNYVEVTVSRPAPLLFMKIFGAEAPVVVARSVAGVRPKPSCIYVLHPNAEEAVDVGGTAAIRIERCQVQVNSSHSNAVETHGSGFIKGDTVNIVGGYTGTGYDPAPNTGVEALADPLADLAPPSFPLTCHHINRVVKKVETLSPGVYCGGLKVTTSNGRAYLNPGTYVIMGGDLVVSAGAEIHGSEVMIYHTAGLGYSSGKIVLAAGGHAVLTAPTSGDYKGILFFQDRSLLTIDANLLSGSPTGKFIGTLYFPKNELELSGGGELRVDEVLIVVNKLKLRGNSTIRGMGDNGGALAGTARLVE